MDNLILNKATVLIKNFEGFRNSAYKDSAGIWTIGYGQTFYRNGKKVSKGDYITESSAEEFLKTEITNIYYQIKYNVKVPLNVNQWASLISLTYNIGVGAFKRSTLLKKINLQKPKEEIVKEFERWIFANGVKLNGLIKRRRKEADNYFQYMQCNLNL